MKRSFLEEFGLEKDAIDKIIAENGSDIENAKATAAKKFDTERETLQGQITELQEQVTQRDTDLKSIQDQLSAAQEDTGKLAKAQESLKELQSKYDNDRKSWEEKNKQQAYEFAVRERAGEIEFSSAGAKRDFIREAIGKNFVMENGTLLGFEEYVNIYKETDPGAFVPEKPTATPEDDTTPKPDIVLPGNPGIPGKGSSLTSMMAAKNANPDMVVSFDN